MTKIFTASLAIVVAMAIASPARALIWAEVGDAGSLPGTAQVTSGPAGPLDTIGGAIFNPPDADMYEIFITGGGTFSATTVGTAGTLGDTQLFLFNAAGLGVYANDNDLSDLLRSTLPAGIALTPTAPGNYFLLITGFNLDPASAGGLIFPDSPSTVVFGPTGPGGGSPISNYAGSIEAGGTYTIHLTGAEFAHAEVPEPITMLLLGSGLVGAWGFRKKFNK